MVEKRHLALQEERMAKQFGTFKEEKLRNSQEGKMLGKTNN